MDTKQSSIHFKRLISAFKRTNSWCASVATRLTKLLRPLRVNILSSSSRLQIPTRFLAQSREEVNNVCKVLIHVNSHLSFCTAILLRSPSPSIIFVTVTVHEQFLVMVLFRSKLTSAFFCDNKLLFFKVKFIIKQDIK